MTITKEQLKKVFIIAIGFTAILGAVDLWGIPFWGTDLVKLYAQQFWFFAFLAITIGALMVWVFNKDKSDAIAVGSIFYILSTSGWEDFWFYLLKDGALPASMPHLFSHHIMGNVAKIMGYTTVNPTSLLVSMGLALIAAYYLSRYLIRRF